MKNFHCRNEKFSALIRTVPFSWPIKGRFLLCKHRYESAVLQWNRLTSPTAARATLNRNGFFQFPRLSNQVEGKLNQFREQSSGGGSNNLSAKPETLPFKDIPEARTRGNYSKYFSSPHRSGKKFSSKISILPPSALATTIMFRLTPL